KSLAFVLVLTFLVSIIAMTGCGTKQAPPVPADSQKAVKRDDIGKNGMVTSAHPLATQAGLDVLKKGGNAFDAAVAVAFMLAVVEPNATSITGGGWAILYDAKTKKSEVCDYRGVGSNKLTKDFYKKDEKGKIIGDAMKTGYTSASVPGQLRGMEEINRKYGTMKWAELVTPAAKQAREGIVVSKTLYGVIEDTYSRMEKFPSLKTFWEKTYLKDGLPRPVGDVVKNPELADSLEKIAKGGADVFYKGEIADAIEKEFSKPTDPAVKGWVDKKQLAEYKVIWREPARGSYRGYDIFACSPPAGGTSVINILNILENYDLKKMGFGSADHWHHFIEAAKLAFATQDKYLGDPGFIKIPVAGITSKEYAKEQVKLLDPKKAMDKKYGAGDAAKYEHGSTTSFSVIDKDGNMVCATQTVNAFFGSGVVPEGTGIIWDDLNDSYSSDPKSPNAPEPGKRTFSSIAGTLVVKDGKPVLAIGSPGGARIITTVSEIISNVIDFGMNVQEAIEAPRVFNRGTGAATDIESRLPADIRAELEKRGHKLAVKGAMDLHFGGAQGIVLKANGELHGGADPRRDGVARGY
ncbi:MAG TPA: gamma-glutamyltransferase, partial [Negativicutes bacterium]|nr:gamma-glutamyltransferase [Negativicutes bacterium]